MSLLGKAALFVVKELAQPTLENLGKHLGDAIGTVLVRKIQHDHESPKNDEDEDEADDEDSDEIDEDERTP